jgi:hypothetical protein
MYKNLISGFYSTLMQSCYFGVDETDTDDKEHVDEYHLDWVHGGGGVAGRHPDSDVASKALP